MYSLITDTATSKTLKSLSAHPIDTPKCAVLTSSIVPTSSEPLQFLCNASIANLDFCVIDAVLDAFIGPERLEAVLTNKDVFYASSSYSIRYPKSQYPVNDTSYYRVTANRTFRVFRPGTFSNMV